MAFALATGPIAAQNQSPVYVDDSPTAEQVLAQLPRLVAQQNLAEAAANIQRLLDEEPARLVADADDPDLYSSVRGRMHAALLASPALLERYRLTQEPRARRLLEEGQAEQVERSLLLTRAGVDAALTLATDHFEHARFHAAAQTVAQLRAHPDVISDKQLAAACAELLARGAPYAEGEQVRPRAIEFARLTGTADQITPESMHPLEAPASARLRSVGLADPGPAFTPGELLARPLRSAPILAAGLANEAALLRGHPALRAEPRPWAMPVLTGEPVEIESVRAQRVPGRVRLAGCSCPPRAARCSWTRSAPPLRSGASRWTTPVRPSAWATSSSSPTTCTSTPTCPGPPPSRPSASAWPWRPTTRTSR